jgi:hypothetical protein
MKIWHPGIRAWIALDKGQLETTRDNLSKIIDFGINRRNFLLLLTRLPIASLLLIKLGQIIRAIEIYTLLCQYPYVRNSQWFADVFGKHIEKAAQSLPPDVVETAKARGRELDIWETAESLLKELNEDLIVRESEQQLSKSID